MALQFPLILAIHKGNPMTKKHFIVIAETIRSNLYRSTQAERWRLETLATELCDDFQSINPRFDRTTFLTACGHSLYGN